MTQSSSHRNVTAEHLSRLDPDRRRHLLRRLRHRSNYGTWFLPATGSPPSPDVDLFCFPYAGAGASLFHDWQSNSQLGRQVCIMPVQPPGRENRLAEPPHRRMSELVDELVQALVPQLSRPFAFFGHSMGALMAYEVACALRDRGLPEPSRLLVSAFRAPHLPSANIRIYHLPDEVLKIVLAKDGVSPEVLANDELMNALLPTLRADLEMCDTYEVVDRPPLSIPISAFGGDHDVRVGPDDLSSWRAHTTAQFDLTMLPGDHFYLHAASDQLITEVGRRLNVSPSNNASIHGGDRA